MGGAHVHRGAGGKHHIDLWACNKDQLIAAGLPEGSVTVTGLCSVCHDPDLFYSNRRQGDDRGSMIALISLLQ
ncbi:MAG: laccase domain-containing protein [Christensenellales bacterium]|jgi:copper oxidase (laccase) domain-containing protein